MAKENYEIVFERIEGHEANPEYFGPKTGMHVRRPSKAEPSSLYDCLDIVKPLPNDTLVEVILYERHDNKYVPGFIKYRNNLCEYLAKERKPIISDFGKIFRFPPTCPIVGRFTVENYRPDDKILPPVLPGPEHWKLFFGLTSQGATLIKHAVVFSIDRSKAIRGGGRG